MLNIINVLLNAVVVLMEAFGLWYTHWSPRSKRKEKLEEQKAGAIPEVGRKIQICVEASEQSPLFARREAKHIWRLVNGSGERVLICGQVKLETDPPVIGFENPVTIEPGESITFRVRHKYADPPLRRLRLRVKGTLDEVLAVPLMDGPWG